MTALAFSAPIGFVAVISGWITTEAGRQPWVVQDWLRTEEAVSAISGESVAFSLSLFLVVYAVLLVVFLTYLRFAIKKGPGSEEPTPSVPTQPATQTGDLGGAPNHRAPAPVVKAESPRLLSREAKPWTSR